MCGSCLLLLTILGMAKCTLCRLGQNQAYVRFYGVYTIFPAGKFPQIKSWYTVFMYGSGQGNKSVTHCTLEQFPHCSSKGVRTMFSTIDWWPKVCKGIVNLYKTDLL